MRCAIHRLYSFILLMVITLGGGSLLTYNLCRCAEVHPIDEHTCCGHHDSAAADHSDHDVEYEHRCISETTPLLEYLSNEREHSNTIYVALLGEYTSPHSPKEECCGVSAEWREFDLYLGFDPSSQLLRAPPVALVVS